MEEAINLKISQNPNDGVVIKVETNNEGSVVVSARELYEFFRVG